jgi:hypothetical protein
MKSIRQYLMLTLTLFTLGTNAATVGGVHLPDQQDGFELYGAGLLRKGLFFKIYVGALYAEPGTSAEQILSDSPKRLDIHYFQRTPGKIMIRVAETTLRKNLTPSEYERLRTSMEQLHAAFIDGKKGGCASLVYRPGRGLTYLFDGREIVRINSDEFANAYFKIWLGEHPGSRRMKQQLLTRLGDLLHE